MITILTAFSGAVFAQKAIENSDKILIAGEYSFTQNDINRLTEIFEWLIGGKLTDAQRRRYQALVVEETQTIKDYAKNFATMLRSYEKIQTFDPARREQIRLQLLPDIVDAMEKENTEANRILLSVYRNAKTRTADNKSPDDSGGDDTGNTNSAIKVADLAGIWSTSSVSTERYRSLVTGELSDPSGSIIEYKISPDGEIKHVGYLSSTVYSCTTKLFITRSGRISLSGSNITFDFAPGKRMYQTCSASASRNDTLPAERKTYPFRLKRDEHGLKLCTVESGKDFCIRKKSD